MVVLGLVLLVLGALAILAGVVTADGSTELLGTDVSAVALFLVGVASGVLVLWGFGLAKWGTKRSLRQRRENKRIDELSEKLDERELERREDERRHEDRS